MKKKKDLSNLSDVLNQAIRQYVCGFSYFQIIFIFTPIQARNKVTEIINNAITHYRDDIDLQNLIDFGQREVKI